MTIHAHMSDEFGSYQQGYTLVTISASNQPRMVISKNNMIFHWADDLNEDVALECDSPEDLPFGITFDLVNDSSVDQTFTAGGISYTVPHTKHFWCRVSLVAGAKSFVSTEVVPPA